MELTEAKKLADSVIYYIKDYCKKIEIVGSVRRQCSVINDIDLLCIPIDIVSIKKLIPEISNSVICIGNYKCSFMFNGEHIDINFCYFDYIWVFNMMHHTGSKEENIRLRGIAKKAGYKLSQHGLIRGSDAILIDSEYELYEFLGQEYREPINR